MPQWKNTDNPANSVFWGPSRVKQRANTATRNSLYGNTSAGAIIPGQTVGMFAVDANEVTASQGIPHTGWVLRTTGSGGRAGRVQHEVLVAGGITTSNTSDDALLPQYSLAFLTQPLANSGSTSNNIVVTFTGQAVSAPPGAAITYLWQYSSNNGNAWATTVAVGGFSNQTTTTLSVNANTIANNVLVRLVAAANGGAVNTSSSSARLTVTA